MPYITLCFYCPYSFENQDYYEDVENDLFCFWSTMKRVYLKEGPFAHVCICLDPSFSKFPARVNKLFNPYSIIKYKPLVINISKTLGGVAVKHKTQLRTGYSFLHIKTSMKDIEKMLEITYELQDRSVLSLTKLFGFNRPPYNFKWYDSDLDVYPTTDQRFWMCSEFILFLLQQTKIVPMKLNPRTVTPTEIYVHLKELGIGIEDSLMPAAEIYNKYVDEELVPMDIT